MPGSFSVLPLSKKVYRTDAEKELTVAVPWSGISSMKDIFNGKNYPVQEKTVRLKLAPRDSAFLYQGKM